MKNIISIIALTLSIITPSFAGPSVTLESFQFKQGQAKHYGVAAKLDVGDFSFFCRKALDTDRWNENKATITYTNKLNEYGYVRFECENYYDINRTRYWVSAGTKLNF